MSPPVFLPFLAAILLVGLIASLAVWSRRRVRFKASVLAATALFAVVQFVALTDLLSRPKPIELAWPAPDEETTAVVASEAVEDVAIYLWLKEEGRVEPRSFVLPWNEDMARQLHESGREAEQTGGTLRMRQRNGTNLVEGEKMFYAEPQAPPPPKQVSSAAD